MKEKNLIKIKDNKNIMLIVCCYIALIGIYISNSSMLALLLYFILLIMCLINNKLPFIIIGSSNYLPSVYGISPIVMSIFIMVIVIIVQCIYKRRIFKMIKIDIYDFIFFLFIVWSFITGYYNKDMNYFSGMITAIIFCIVIKLYYLNIKIKADEMLNYLIMGISIGILFTLFIKLQLFGFKSYHISRYAIGERSDPNSTGFLFAIISIYYILSFIENIQGSVKKTIYNIILSVISISCLFLTQSRGSVLCVIASIVIYLILSIFRKKTINIKTILKILIIIIVIIILLITIKPINNFILNSWQTFEDRLTNAESSDGERGTLLKKSINSFFENPITGTSLENFKSDAGHIPHNTFCDYMVTNGVFGIAFYIIYFILQIIKLIKNNNVNLIRKPFFCYLIAFLNILFYSASNEKIIFLLLIILVLSNTENRKEVSNDEKHTITWSNKL